MHGKELEQKLSFRLCASFGRPSMNIYLKEFFEMDWIVTFRADQLQHFQAQSSFRQQSGHVHRRSIDTGHSLPPDDAARPSAFFFPPRRLSSHVGAALVSSDAHSRPTFVFRGRFNSLDTRLSCPFVPPMCHAGTQQTQQKGRPRGALGDDLEPHWWTGEACLLGQEGDGTWTACCQSRTWTEGHACVVQTHAHLAGRCRELRMECRIGDRNTESSPSESAVRG